MESSIREILESCIFEVEHALRKYNDAVFDLNYNLSENGFDELDDDDIQVLIENKGWDEFLEKLEKGE